MEYCQGALGRDPGGSGTGSLRYMLRFLLPCQPSFF